MKEFVVLLFERMSENKELQEEELEALKCIFEEDPFVKLEKEYISFTKEVGVTEPIYFFINEGFFFFLIFVVVCCLLLEKNVFFF